MAKPRVFSDTGTLLAIVIFPRDRHGKLTLAGEVLQLYQEDAFDLVISQVVADELDEVLVRDFPNEHQRAQAFLAPFTAQFTRSPTPQEIAAALPFTTDADDAPIFAAALVARPDIVLSNDFQTFHIPKAKRFWAEHKIQIESLYGLLCVFGKRRRRG